MTAIEAPLRVHAGCPICGAGRAALEPTPSGPRCGTCESEPLDRIVHSVFAEELRDEIDPATARLLLLEVDDCQARLVFGFAQQYRCGESEDADLIAPPSELASLPSSSFDLVVAGEGLGTRQDVDRVIGEASRVLMPGGVLLWPGRAPSGPGRPEHLSVRTLVATDPASRGSATVCLARKEGPPLEPRAEVPASWTGYPYHLSRKAGQRIIFCLDGPSTGDRLPVTSINGETVGHAKVDPYHGDYQAPAEPWQEGFRFPPRATFKLDPSLPSGVYALNGEIPFVNRGRDLASIAVLVPSNTATAFNFAGGRSLYRTDDALPAGVLSFHRPIKPRALLNGCMPFARWFKQANPYSEDTKYLIDTDLEDTDALTGIKVLIVIGRSEYWTRRMREHLDAYIDHGGRVLFLCGELMFLQVRIDLAGHRLCCHKANDSHPDPLLRTTVWHHPSLEYPVHPRTGCEFRYGGSNAVDKGIGWRGMRVVSPDSPVLSDCSLGVGDVISLPDAIAWDGAPVEHRSDGSVRVDFGDSPPWRHEVVAYNLVRPAIGERRSKPATSLWIVLRRTPTSGTVVHCGTMGWCGPRIMGRQDPNSDRVRAIILRMLDVLYEDRWPFSDAVQGEGEMDATAVRQPLPFSQ